MEQHTITIARGGKVKIEVSGIKGSSCQEATRQIERALGSVTSDTPTEEMYATDTDRAKDFA
jgi:hypothetical protein